MKTLDLHLIRRMCAWTAILTATSVALFVLTQTLRIGPLFVGANDLSEGLAALGWVALAGTGWSLTPAFGIAVFATAGRMSEDGELVAVDAAGISRLRIVRGPVLLAVALTALSAWYALWGGPTAASSLDNSMQRLAASSFLGRLEPGRFHSLGSDLAFFADGAGGLGEFSGVFVEKRASAGTGAESFQIVALEMFVNWDPASSRVRLDLRRGSGIIVRSSGSDQRAAIEFDRMTFLLPLDRVAGGGFDFLPPAMTLSTKELFAAPPPGSDPFIWSFGLHRRFALPVGFACFAGLSLVLAFWGIRTGYGVSIGLAVALFIIYHVSVRAFESLGSAGHMGPVQAAFGPMVLLGVLFAYVVFLFGLRPRLFFGRPTS